MSVTKDDIEMFNYEKLIKYIPTIKLNNTMNIELKFRLIFILLFVHLLMYLYYIH